MSFQTIRRPSASGSQSARSVTVRRASRADLPALERIEAESFSGDRLSPRSLRTLIARPSASVLVAQLGAEVVGSVIVLYRRTASVGRLYSLAVEPRARGLGVAVKLLGAAEEDAVSRRQSAVRLEVRADNAAAIALYDRAGYRISGRRTNYYQDGETALLFRKTLAPQKAAASVARAAAAAR